MRFVCKDELKFQTCVMILYNPLRSSEHMTTKQNVRTACIPNSRWGHFKQELADLYEYDFLNI